MPTLNDILGRKGVTFRDVRDHLASLSPEARVREATSLDGGRQGVLWELCEGNAKVTAEDLVPGSVPDLTPVPFEGQNSQPAFRSFQKVFYRMPGGKLGGRNVGALAPLIGDGYYVVEYDRDGAYVDYTQVPNVAPAGWPAIKRNDRGVSTLVFGFMKDHLRRVDGNVLIGHARKPIVGSQGYFVLARV